MENPYVIIGGDAAGMSAASKIKRENPAAEVIVFERDIHISYSACGMPYWIAGVIESDRKLIIMTSEVARRRRGIDVRLRHEVTNIDCTNRLIDVCNLETGETLNQAYSKLLIATGARPNIPPVPGIDLPGVFSLRSLTDGQRIFRYMAEHDPRRAVIIGGGYIGIEMAEALRDRSLDVHLLEILPQIMPNFDSEIVEEVATHLREQGVEVMTSTRFAGIDAGDTSLNVLIGNDSRTLAADLVLVSTGIRPNVELARSAGLRLGESGAIWVDQHMVTSDPNIFAAGDCVEHHHLVLGRNAWIPLATSANKGGRTAGENMLGGDSVFPGILGTAVVKAFDYTMATTGLTERQAKAGDDFGTNGKYVGSAMIRNPDKAGYWPGAEELAVKLVFDKRSGRILGGQIVGKAGVNKRIDIVATAITAQMTVADVGMLDLSYAPPYSPTYDPIQICANVATRDVLGAAAVSS